MTGHPKKHSKFRKFLIRWKGLLNIVLSTLSLIAFYVKEVETEKYRDQNNRIESAENTFLIRMDVADAAAISKSIVYANNIENVRRADPSALYLIFVSPAQQVAWTEMSDKSAKIDALARLLDACNGNDTGHTRGNIMAEKKEFEMFRDTAQANTTSWSKTRMALEQLSTTHDVNTPEFRAAEINATKAFADLDIHVQDAWSKLRKVTDDVSKYADDHRKHNDSRIEVYTWITYVLFGLWWLVNLLCSVAGMEQESPVG